MTNPAVDSAQHHHPSRGDYEEQWRRHDIGFLIISTKGFIVYIDKKGDLEWETTPEYDKETERKKEYDLKKHDAIRIDAAVLEATPCEGFDPQTRQQFKRLIGEALACSLNLDYAGAQSVIDAARQYFQARSEETSRTWYLSASSWATLPFIVVGVVLWQFRSFFIAWEGSTAFWLALSTCAGALGALFSVITRTGRLKFDCSAGLRLHYLEGSSRIVVGAISGLLVALAVGSEMILAPLVQGGRLHLVMTLAALAAGAGERLATSIISTFDATRIKSPDAISDKDHLKDQQGSHK